MKMVRRSAFTMGLVTFVVAGCSVRMSDDGGPFDKRARVRRFLEGAHADRRDIVTEVVSPKLLAEAPLEAIMERVHLVEEVKGPYVGLAERFQTSEGTDVGSIEIEVRFQRGTSKGSFRFDREGTAWKLRSFTSSSSMAFRWRPGRKSTASRASWWPPFARTDPATSTPS